MPTNIQLELQISELKTEVADLKLQLATLKASSAESVKADLDSLKKNLTTVFDRARELDDLSRKWSDLTYVAPEPIIAPLPVSEPKKTTVTHETIDAALDAVKQFGALQAQGK